MKPSILKLRAFARASGNRIVPAVVLIGVICGTAPLHAAVATAPAQPWDAVTRLPGGVDVEIEPHSGERVTGELQSASDEAVILTVDGRSVEPTRSAIRFEAAKAGTGQE